MGTCFRLTAKTHKGKNILSIHGDLWEIHKTETWPTGENGKGQIAIRSLRTDDWRWVHSVDCKDFWFDRVERIA